MLGCGCVLYQPSRAGPASPPGTPAAAPRRGTRRPRLETPVSSLWTPDGERPVARDGGGGTGSPAAGAEDVADANEPLRAAAQALGIDLDSLTEAERQELAAELSEMMRVRQEIAATPAAEMISNHLIRFLDLATIYLEGDPPAFAEAATAIEAFRCVLEGVGDRLGEHQPMLTEALGQVQMIFVQVKQAHEGQAPTT